MNAIHVNGRMNGHANGHVQHLDGADLDSELWREQLGPGATEPEEDAAAAGLEFDHDILVGTASPATIKGVMSPGDLIALYGPSGVGKTFVALAVEYAVAHGQPFFGRKTKKGAVLYVGLEGQRGMRHRMLAAAQVYGPARHMVARLTLPAPLDKTDRGAKGVATIVRAANRQSTLAGCPVVLIVVDTLSRAMAGDDENSAQDMSAFVERRVAEIQRKTGAAVMVVHHAGKDATRGPRGSTVLFAACDCVLKVTEDHRVELEKVKDGELGPWFSFRLRPVTLGQDEDGDTITSCVVEADIADKAKRKAHLSQTEKRALDMLHRLYSDGHAFDVRAAEIDLSGIEPHKMPRVVKLTDWRDKCAEAKLCSSADARSEARAFQRSVSALATKGNIAHFGDYAWLLGQERRPATNAKTLAISRPRQDATSGDDPVAVVPRLSCDPVSDNGDKPPIRACRLSHVAKPDTAGGVA